MRAPFVCPHCPWGEPLVFLVQGGLACHVCGCLFLLSPRATLIRLVAPNQEGGPS